MSISGEYPGTLSRLRSAGDDPIRLTKKDIERPSTRRTYGDGRGLFLSVSKTGSKTWAFCYRFPNSDSPTGYRERDMGLGSIDFMSVGEARDRAVELRRMVRQGVDLVAERHRETRAVVRHRTGSRD